MSDSIESKHSILLFDGVCNMCNHWVDFMLANEKKEIFLFASLQSTSGRKIASQYQIPSTVDSVIVIINGVAYTHSDAVFQALLALPWYWRWVQVFRLIPRKWRDLLYKKVAKSRYRLFGKRDTCRIPSANERKRFLNDDRI